MRTTNAELKRLRSELRASQGTTLAATAKLIALLSQPGTQMYSLIGTASTPKNNRLATARLLAKPGDRTVALVAQDLPKLPNNQIYRLWSVAKPAAAPVYCGQFRLDDNDAAQWVAPHVACTKKPSQLLITLDAPTDPITSAGSLVMRSPS